MVDSWGCSRLKVVADQNKRAGLAAMAVISTFLLGASFAPAKTATASHDATKRKLFA
jgi:hypothetical protein